MDETIKNLLIGALFLAAVATAIAFAITYWYYFVGVGIAALIVYFIYQQSANERNKV